MCNGLPWCPTIFPAKHLLAVWHAPAFTYPTVCNGMAAKEKVGSPYFAVGGQQSSVLKKKFTLHKGGLCKYSHIYTCIYKWTKSRVAAAKKEQIQEE